jgi:hypothetical protein
MSAAYRAAKSRPRAGAEQAAANCTLGRIVWVRAPGQPQDEGRCNNAGSDQSIHHDFLLQSLAQQRIERKNSSCDICALLMWSNLSIDYPLSS